MKCFSSSNNCGFITVNDCQIYLTLCLHCILEFPFINKCLNNLSSHKIYCSSIGKNIPSFVALLTIQDMNNLSSDVQYRIK